MIVKKNHILLTSALCIGVLTGCDNIDEQDRYIHVDREHSEKTVLLQEFTGQNCAYCSVGAMIIEGLHDAYGDNFVAVGMHPFGTVFNESLDGVELSSDIATVYYNYYGKPSQFPGAVIDGTSFEGKYVQDNRNKWGTFVEEQMKLVPPVNIELETVFSEPQSVGESGKVTVRYKAKFTEVMDEDCSFLIWVIENGIQAIQMSPRGPIMNYTHNHVLRCSANGDWGESMGSGFVPDTEWEGEATVSLKQNWNPENCQIVGVVFKTDSKNVMQASLADVIEKSNN